MNRSTKRCLEVEQRNKDLEAQVEHEKRRADDLHGRRIYELEAQVAMMREALIKLRPEMRRLVMTNACGGSLPVCEEIIDKAMNQVRKESFEKAAETVLRKRKNDKYPKCCMRAMKDANISSALYIREEMNKERK